MKRYFLTMLIAVVSCVTAMAGDDIKLTDGTISSLKDGGLGSVIIDMTDTRFDNKKPLRNDERFANIDTQLPECTEEFIREFNDNSKKFKLTENAEDAQYEFNIQITNLDAFLNVMSFKGGAGVKLFGTVTIKDKKEGDNIAVFKIDGENNSGLNYQIALEESFEGIAKYLAKRINKGK